MTVCTRGGNQSWNGVVKRLDPARYDYLFVLVADGRRWFMPSEAAVGGTKICLGGPVYAEYEIEPDPNGLRSVRPMKLLESAARRDSEAVKRSGL